jgi:hypothetical protein
MSTHRGRFRATYCCLARIWTDNDGSSATNLKCNEQSGVGLPAANSRRPDFFMPPNPMAYSLDGSADDVDRCGLREVRKAKNSNVTL